MEHMTAQSICKSLDNDFSKRGWKIVFISKENEQYIKCRLKSFCGVVFYVCNNKIYLFEEVFECGKNYFGNKRYLVTFDEPNLEDYQLGKLTRENILDLCHIYVTNGRGAHSRNKSLMALIKDQINYIQEITN